MVLLYFRREKNGFRHVVASQFRFVASGAYASPQVPVRQTKTKVIVRLPRVHESLVAVTSLTMVDPKQSKSEGLPFRNERKSSMVSSIPNHLVGFPFNELLTTGIRADPSSSHNKFLGQLTCKYNKSEPRKMANAK